MSDLAPDDLLQHTALSEPRNSEPSRGMWGSIRDVLGHPITQGGLLQGQTVLTLKKEATAFALLFRGECNQSLIQFAAQYYVPSARAGFCAAGRSAAETSVSDRYGGSQGIPGSLLLVVAVDPHSLDLANSKSGATQESVDQSLLFRLRLAKQSLYFIACETRCVLFVAIYSGGVNHTALPRAGEKFFSFGIGGRRNDELDYKNVISQRGWCPLELLGILDKLSHRSVLKILKSGLRAYDGQNCFCSALKSGEG